MSAVDRLGAILALVGGLLLAIAGVIVWVPGQVVLEWFTGLAWLLLGVGVAVFALPHLFGGGSTRREA